MDDTPLPDVLKALDFEPAPPPCISPTHPTRNATMRGFLPCGHAGLLCTACYGLVSIAAHAMPNTSTTCTVCQAQAVMRDLTFEELT
jgi:hypothetical protein